MTSPRPSKKCLSSVKARVAIFFNCLLIVFSFLAAKAQLNTSNCALSVRACVRASENCISPCFLGPLCPFMPLYSPLCPFVPLYATLCHFMPFYSAFCPFMPLYAPLFPFMSLYVPLWPFMPLYAPLCPFIPLYKLLHAFTYFISWAAPKTSS